MSKSATTGFSALHSAHSCRRLTPRGQNRAVSSSKTLSLTPVRFKVSKIVQTASALVSSERVTTGNR